MDHGFAILHRTWNPGDSVQVTLPMPARQVLANSRVEADRGLVAIQRGPLVYCLEWPDNPDNQVLNLRLARNPDLTSDFRSDLLNGIAVISGNGYQFTDSGSPQARSTPALVTAIPYYAWANRGKGEMTVWIPEPE
jgi:DUF1680 family protein